MATSPRVGHPAAGVPEVPPNRSEALPPPVAPSAPRGQVPLVTPETPDGPPSAADRAEARVPPPPATPAMLRYLAQADVLGEVGARLSGQLEGLVTLLGEARDATAELREDVPEASRARLQKHAVRIDDILGWIGTTVTGLGRTALDVHTGKGVVDSVELLREVVDCPWRTAAYPGVRVLVPLGAPMRARCTARAAGLVEIWHLALGLLAERLGGRGTIEAACEVVGDELVHRFEGHGAEHGVRCAEDAARLRQLVVGEHGGRLRRLDHGQGPGLEITLPRA